jgi:hypothetical protein
VTTADWHPSTIPHRHLWIREGRRLEVCAHCPAARACSRVARSFSWVALALGLLALAGMLLGISHSNGRLTRVQCASPGSISLSTGAGC